ncbi:TRM11 family SAM-dependent methyltransferase [Mariniluteicoccus flavus]
MIVPMQFLMLVCPSANRVYAGVADRLAAAELRITAGLDAAAPERIAGVDYLAFEGEPTDELLAAIGRQSAHLALFGREGDLLRPIAVPHTDRLDDDLVTIPKYPGKTNEQFTRLLLNVTLAAVDAPTDRRWTVLDPLCGRGTTLGQAWLLGLDAAGVEGDVKAVEQLASFWKTWLRRKRLKHTADMTPVRREGKSLGKRFEARVTLPAVDGAEGTDTVTATVFTGDTRQSAALFGKRRFEAIVADAPYGVVHGSQTDVRGVSGKRDRSAAGLLGESIKVWAGQLKPGGALGLSWNTLGLSREDLAVHFTAAGLHVHTEGPWLDLAHRVDSSIHRDILVGTAPTA